MKEYYSKWMFVPGEIQPGDYAMASDTGYAFKVDRIGYYEGNDGAYREDMKNVKMVFYEGDGMSELSDVKKAAMFICDRDIQVGDRVKLKEGTEEFEVLGKRVYGWSQILIQPEGQESVWKTQRHFHKVIGQLSPKAIWVAQYAKFNEEQVDFLYQHRSFRDEDFISTEPYSKSDWKEGEEEKYTCIVQVQCPTCKIFH